MQAINFFFLVAPHAMWDIPEPRIEPMSPLLEM